MGIPESCKDCPRVTEIARQPIQGFKERIEQATGKRVLSSSWAESDISSVIVEGQRGPEAVSSGIVSSAWFAEIGARRKQEKAIDNLVTDCPGMLDAHVEVNNENVVIQVCGKTALEAAAKVLEDI
jgi:hypothetical protein